MRGARDGGWTKRTVAGGNAGSPVEDDSGRLTAN